MKGNEKIIITDDYIFNPENNHHIMHVCETKIMKRQAEISTQNGGDILELGFGMHISADFIQSNPNVTSHTIIEIHPIQYERALEWAKDKRNVEVILGDWYNVLPLENRKFDGILFDTDTDGNLPYFMDKVKSNCKEGTVLSFYAYYRPEIRLNSEIISFTDEEVETWPDSWKNHRMFQNNQYVMYHSKFNGVDFYANEPKKIL
jgi:spermidine synthase